MPGRVELINRVLQPDTERGLDLRGLAHRQERVEVLERLHVESAGRRRQSLRGELADHAVDVLPRHLPRRAPARVQEPLQRPAPVDDGQLAEPPGDLRHLERSQALLLEGRRVQRRINRLRRPARDDPQPASLHLCCSPLNAQGATLRSVTMP